MLETARQFQSEQPLLPPGGVHEYNSFCVLKSPSGWMEGYYTFAREDGNVLRLFDEIVRGGIAVAASDGHRSGT